MEFDNRSCDCCSWKLYWVTPDGERMQYGQVQEGATFQQTTFPGHTWLLVAAGETAATKRKELQYTAASEPCVAMIGDDAGCVRP